MKSFRHIIAMIGAVLLAACWQSATAQGDTLNRVDDKGRKQGYWIKRYPTDTVQYEGRFADDRPVGLLKRYYENGRLMAEIDYGEGRGTSSARLYHVNGVLMAAGSYAGKEKDGLWKYYNEEGHHTSQESFRSGVQHGEFIEYYPKTGSVVNKVTWADGKKHGEWLQQFEDGSLKLKGAYTDDHLHGEIVFYHPGGKTQMKGAYNMGLKEGGWVYYLDDGRVHSTAMYKQGFMTASNKVNGEFADYYPGRIPHFVTTYSNGKKNGPHTEYYPSGEWVVTEEVNKDGEKDRVEKLVGQIIKKKANFVNDRLEGEVIYYRDDGSTEKTEKYKDGVLMK